MTDENSRPYDERPAARPDPQIREQQQAEQAQQQRKRGPGCCGVITALFILSVVAVVVGVTVSVFGH